MESTRKQLISLLEMNKETYISGQELSNQLKISRTAVWKHMKELEKDGYVIEAVSRKGYQIRQFPEKISSNTLQWGLHTNWLGKHLIHRNKIKSTQDFGHQLAAKNFEHGTVIIADHQTDGKGRMERQWHSPEGQGIWMSLLLRPNILPYDAPQLTLLTATVLADLIKTEVGIEPAIKWPNDILINDKKVAGILTEMQAEQDRIKYVVLGIGFNVNQSKEMLPSDISNKATSIKMETGKSWDQKKLIHYLLDKFEQQYEQYVKYGFSSIQKNWEKYGYKLGESVILSTSHQKKVVELKGIERDGALRIQNADGTIEKIYSAEINW